MYMYIERCNEGTLGMFVVAFRVCIGVLYMVHWRFTASTFDCIGDVLMG